jgi:hypothetical protein
MLRECASAYGLRAPERGGARCCANTIRGDKRFSRPSWFHVEHLACSLGSIAAVVDRQKLGVPGCVLLRRLPINSNHAAMLQLRGSRGRETVLHTSYQVDCLLPLTEQMRAEPRRIKPAAARSAQRLETRNLQEIKSARSRAMAAANSTAVLPGNRWIVSNTRFACAPRTRLWRSAASVLVDGSVRRDLGAGITRL